MQVTTSYKVKILGYNKIFEETLAIYREALAYLINVTNIEWDSIKDIKWSKEKGRYIDNLVHGTSTREAKYDFDKKFYKFPTYFRYAVINEAIGKVSSYKSNLKNWIDDGQKGKVPKLNTKHKAYPALYKTDIFRRKDNYSAKIKIYHKKIGYGLRLV